MKIFVNNLWLPGNANKCKTFFSINSERIFFDLLKIELHNIFGAQKIGSQVEQNRQKVVDRKGQTLQSSDVIINVVTLNNFVLTSVARLTAPAPNLAYSSKHSKT